MTEGIFRLVIKRKKLCYVLNEINIFRILLEWRAEAEAGILRANSTLGLCQPVLWIRVRRIRLFLCLPDQDPS